MRVKHSRIFSSDTSIRDCDRYAEPMKCEIIGKFVGAVGDFFNGIPDVVSTVANGVVDTAKNVAPMLAAVPGPWQLPAAALNAANAAYHGDAKGMVSAGLSAFTAGGGFGGSAASAASNAASIEQQILDAAAASGQTMTAAEVASAAAAYTQAGWTGASLAAAQMQSGIAGLDAASAMNYANNGYSVADLSLIHI